MYCLIQFYVQLREPLSEHKPFLKVLAIKLVIFLSFWQTIAISLGTSTLHIVNPNSILAYPDIKVGVPSLMLCFEMAVFAILHLWAFPYAPYVEGAKTGFYPNPDPSLGVPPRENEHGSNKGGFMGLKAFADALNLWDIVKAFGRGMRWLFVGVKRRHQDPSYRTNPDVVTSYPMQPFGAAEPGTKSTDHLPIASEFRRSTFGIKASGNPLPEESAGLIMHAQTNPGSSQRRLSNPYLDPTHPPVHNPSRGYTPYDEPGGDIGIASTRYDNDPQPVYGRQGGSTAGWSEPQNPQHAQHAQHTQHARRMAARTSTQVHVGNALWGDRSPRDPPNRF